MLVPEGEHDGRVEVDVEGELGEDEEGVGEVAEDKDKAAGASRWDEGREHREAAG